MKILIKLLRLSNYLKKNSEIMKILLINVRGKWLISKNNSIKVASPPLGIMSLSAYLKKNISHKLKIELLDTQINFSDLKDIIKKINKFKPDIVGISGISLYKKEFNNISRCIRENSNALIVGGGPYITTDNLKDLENSEINIGIIGEGERSFTEIVNRVINNENLNNIKGTILRFNNKMIIQKENQIINNIDLLPIPDYSIIDLNKYSNFLSLGYNYRKQGVINTSRGCPFKCDFCHNIFGKKIRLQSPDRVIKEIKFLLNKGVKDIYFVDDNFNLDKKRVMSFFNKIIKLNLHKKIRFYFVNGLRGDLVDFELIDKMIEGGTIWISYAIETSSQRLQKIMGKNLNIEKVKENIEYTHSKGIIVNYWFLLGHPEETIKEAENSIIFLENLPPSCIPMLFSLQNHPGTKLYSEKNKNSEKYHNFIDLILKDRRYVPIIEKWHEIINQEYRIKLIIQRFKNNNYSFKEIKDIMKLLYDVDENKFNKLINSKIENENVAYIKRDLIEDKLKANGFIISIGGNFVFTSKFIEIKNKIYKIIKKILNEAKLKEIEFPLMVDYNQLNMDKEIKIGRYLNSFRIYDFNKTNYFLTRTCEEIAAKYFSVNLKNKKIYQIKTKFRKEIKKELNFLKRIEFSMLDAYSIDSSQKKAKESFYMMLEVYSKILEKLGIKFYKKFSYEKKFNMEVELVSCEEELNGLELGHLFCLGNKYTKKYENIKKMYMNSYGIGIDRIITCIILKEIKK